MARIVSGPYVAGQVTSRETGAPLGGVTVTISQTVYTDPEMSIGTTAIAADGNGRYSFYAPPGHYTFTTSATNANPIEAVEVLGGELGTRATLSGGGSSGVVSYVWDSGTSTYVEGPVNIFEGPTDPATVSGLVVSTWDLWVDSS